MKIAIAADHEGFQLKEKIIISYLNRGISLIDLGTYNEESTDYPIYAEKVGLSILNQEAERGILLCGSGIGICFAANKIPGIRAGICHDTYSAHQGVEHDDMNVLVLGAKIISTQLAEEIVNQFLNARFMQEERFLRRLKEVTELEHRYCNGGTYSS